MLVSFIPCLTFVHSYMLFKLHQHSYSSVLVYYIVYAPDWCLTCCYIRAYTLRSRSGLCIPHITRVITIGHSDWMFSRSHPQAQAHTHTHPHRMAKTLLEGISRAHIMMHKYMCATSAWMVFGGDAVTLGRDFINLQCAGTPIEIWPCATFSARFYYICLWVWNSNFIYTELPCETTVSIAGYRGGRNRV